MIKVAIYGRPTITKHMDTVQLFFNEIQAANIVYILYTPLKEHLDKYIPNQIRGVKTFDNYDNFDRNSDYVLSLGGDGTILDTLTIIKDCEIPVIGINFGRLGFLASIGREDINQAIKAIEEESYTYDARSLIQLDSNQPLFEKQNFALNEMTIQRKDTSSMITVKAYINGELLNAYFADGIIISTPTGSTGYAMSCGGAIIHPTSASFIVAPVAPHNLNVRPIVVSDDVVLSFEIEGRAKNFLCTLDARVETIDASFELAIKKAPFCMKLARLSDTSFLNALRDKLFWGMDQRN